MTLTALEAPMEAFVPKKISCVLKLDEIKLDFDYDCNTGPVLEKHYLSLYVTCGEIVIALFKFTRLFMVRIAKFSPGNL